MFKGYRKHLFYKDITNKTITLLPQMSKCSRCKKINTITFPSFNNTQICIFCGQPFYIIKPS